MKKAILTLFAVLVLPFAVMNETRANLDPRIKALGTMALYGTAGGALLGTASLAFDGKGRNIFKGASLGLYAGILFGGYIVTTHYLKERRANSPPVARDNYYPDTEGSPYESEGGGGAYEDNAGQRWSPYLELQWEGLSRIDPFERPNKKEEIPLFYLDLIQLSF